MQYSGKPVGCTVCLWWVSRCVFFPYIYYHLFVYGIFHLHLRIKIPFACVKIFQYLALKKISSAVFRNVALRVCSMLPLVRFRLMHFLINGIWTIAPFTSVYDNIRCKYDLSNLNFVVQFQNHDLASLTKINSYYLLLTLKLMQTMKEV